MKNRIRLTKIASFTKELDQIANEIEKHNPKIALAIDRISDHMESRYSGESQIWTHRGVEAPKSGIITFFNMHTRDQEEGQLVVRDGGYLTISKKLGDKNDPIKIPKGAILPERVKDGARIIRGDLLYNYRGH